MSTLSDQLKALGLRPAEQAEVIGASTPKGKHNPKAREPRDRGPRKLVPHYLELNRIGTVARLEEKGFGFIATDNEPSIFFHFRGFPEKLFGEQKLPPVGTPVLFITGSDRRHPNASRKGVVRWAPLAVVPALAKLATTDQTSMDAGRRSALEALPAREFWDLLAASWYEKDWAESGRAPVDLEDPILANVVAERLSAMSVSDLHRTQVSHRLAKSHYRFAVRMSPASPDCDFARLMKDLDTHQLGALGSPRLEWLIQKLVPPTLQEQLLEWHLLSRTLREERVDWSNWFPGTSRSEVALATRILEMDLSRDQFTEDWLQRVAESELLSASEAEAWSDRDTGLALRALPSLPEARRDSLVATWRVKPGELRHHLDRKPELGRTALGATAFAFDLETDGERIWEVGCASNGQSQWLHDERKGTDLDSALVQLRQRIEAVPLVVGHNVLSWDWPAAARHAKVTTVPLIWDTLLVQYLLEPQAASHALGGQHRADQDALDALNLFKGQLARLPPAFACRVLMGEIKDSMQLLEEMIAAWAESADYARKLPEGFSESETASDTLTVVPDHLLRHTNWVPGVSVVSAYPEQGLGAEWQQLDSDALEQRLPAQSRSAAARVLLGVAKLASAQGIALRRNMIPFWLTESDSGLASAVDAACAVPGQGRGRRIAALPSNYEGWARLDASSSFIAGLCSDVLVFDRKQVGDSDLAEDVRAFTAATFLRLGGSGAALHWLTTDRAARVLDPRGGRVAFTTFAINGGDRGHAVEPPTLTHRPRFARRRQHVLHPRAEDQGAYWSEVLRTFQEVSVGQESVPILLVSSSRSRALLELLATALAEIGICELKPEHRSQREHLLRAARRDLALIDSVDHWRDWQALAESARIRLQPVIEALPLEEWYACAETRAATSADPAGGKAESGPIASAISAAAILESVTGLMRSQLSGWLAEVGLEASSDPVIVIDPRVGDPGARLSELVESFPLAEAPLSSEQAQRLKLALSPLELVREAAPSGLEAMESFLVANWQPRAGAGGNAVTGFKPLQRLAMQAICERSSNVLVALPTGEGKSVLFQVPALCRGLRNRRLTLVISPLKALMRDQVERLREQGFSDSVDYLSGDRTPYEMAEVIQGILDHRIVLLYVAPERTRSEVFLDVLLKRMKADAGLEHVVVDETHCVNQWGYEFRPDYFHALTLLLRLCREHDGAAPTPFLLLSATITATDRACLHAIMAGEAGEFGSPLPLVARPESFTNPLRDHIGVEPKRVRGMLNDRREFDKVLAERLPYIEAVIAKARANRLSTTQRSAVIVFVSSRHHAEVVAQRLAQEANGQVDYYHAGLDSGTREEIYTRFLDGDLDVLVATKAFGMGMDIPDIHWVVHLAPPAYLEDYLQEVGRIGRGERERKNAGLEKLSATMLFSDLDFESIRGMRARSALSLPVIRDLHDKVSEHAHEVEGLKLAVVPAEGYSTPQTPAPRSAAARHAAATRVRMGLYWLERAGRIQLCGSVPDLIEVTAYPAALARIATEVGAAAEVAGQIALLDLEEPRFQGTSAGEARPARAAAGSSAPADGLFGTLGRLFSTLSETVGPLFERATKASPPETVRQAFPKAASTPLVEARTVILNLSQIRSRSRILKTADDVLAVLGDLEKRGAIALNKEIEVVSRKLATEPADQIARLFQYVDGGTVELLRRLSKKGRIEFTPFEMVDGVAGPKVTGENRRTYERAFINGFRTLARASGVRLRQLVRSDDKVVWEATLPVSAWSRADAKRKRTVQSAKAVLAAVRDKRSIRVSTLIEQVRVGRQDGRFRESDLQKVAGLLSAMSLVSISPELIPLSHVVAITASEGRLEDQVETWGELRKVNELAEARTLAMEVFANIATDAQPDFIEGYFDAIDGSALKQFLDSQLGEIVVADSDGPSTLLLEMQEKLRATQAIEFFERFKQSEEPVQWEVARAPFDRHIMVNAGPGAGKTFVLVGRIAHLIREQNIDPAQIIVLAFNRAVVFEIRRRIRALFKSLGYAAYANRLRVSTFHALAMRSLARDGARVARDQRNSLLSDFVRRLEQDPVFARSVAGGARCILVDEFQDVTDDVYKVIRCLHSGSGASAGVMVIGDDDQDMLRWQRIKDRSAHQFSEQYFDRFADDFGGDGFQSFLLGVNFRSGTSIVDRSQAMIDGFFARTDRSKRLKASRLKARQEVAEGSCHREEWHGCRWGEAISKTERLILDRNDSEQESTAILCRSNAEVAEAHRQLSRTFPKIAVQGTANLRVADLRHVGTWLDTIRELAGVRDVALTQDLRRQIWKKLVDKGGIPELMSPGASDVSLDDLWDLCCREHPYPHLSSLIRFVEELRTDELVRLSGTEGESGAMLVSTLHKVKGLEFDNVVILPSSLPFGADKWGNQTGDIQGDAAEEARVFYVGMTRAKKRLTYFRGDRECAWGRANAEPYAGEPTDGKILAGSMEDIDLGWALKQNPFNAQPDACQRYIESEVSVGDPIKLGGVGDGAFKSLMHQNRSGKLVQVGFLAKKHVRGGPGASLSVSAVVRFRPDDLAKPLAALVRERGWGYVVLVSGLLR